MRDMKLSRTLMLEMWLMEMRLVEMPLTSQQTCVELELCPAHGLNVAETP